MRTKLLILLTFCFSQFGNAQSAKDILDKTSNLYNNSKGISVTFTLNTEDTKTKTTYTHDGKALMKGNKFKIEVPDGITWFDGKTQWVYMKGGDEVNVSNPTGEELVGISPVALLNIYKSGFKLTYKGEKKDKEKNVHEIEMTPLKKNSDIAKYIIRVDKSNYMFTSISLFGKDKTNNHLTIKKYQLDIEMADNTFVFNKKEYPNVDVIDLR